MTDHLLDFTGKGVLITGGATGIGRAAALGFARQGASVAIGDVDARAEETVALIREAGGSALFRRTDVRHAGEVAALVEATVAAFGRLDCAFNNAGILPPAALLADMDEATFENTIAVDLIGVFHAMKYEIRHMLSAGGGAIVNTSSIAGIKGGRAMAPYVAAKHGVIGLTKAGALDYGRNNIRINALAPGFIETAMTQHWIDDPAVLQRLLADNPMGRSAKPDELVGMILYLCSDLASYTTGQVFVVDGAYTAR